MNKETVSNMVVSLLKENEIDGETMENIIVNVGMENQMLKQLVMKASALDLENSIENRQSEVRIRQMVSNSKQQKKLKIDVDVLTQKILDDVVEYVDNGYIEDYELSMNFREVEIENFTLDTERLGREIKLAIEEYLVDIEE